ncbi:hypothetical protein pEaSNUABM55_00218 [Erwinia phage pEa_SNUABM_55]|nr:hypothetical protein pEaSNUABM55_00218 [Erwinia phage pEa_SNUABM_55]
MSHVSETFNVEAQGINFVFSVVNYETNDGLGDQWELTDKHQGGVTVKNRNADRNSYKYGIPLNYSLAERLENLIKGGMSPNEASAQAYQDALNTFDRDLDATDYGLTVSASIDGVDLLDDVVIGCGWDHSYHDDETVLEAAQSIYEEHGILEEAITLAKAAAAEIVGKMDALKNLAK